MLPHFLDSDEQVDKIYLLIQFVLMIGKLLGYLYSFLNYLDTQIRILGLPFMLYIPQLPLPASWLDSLYSLYHFLGFYICAFLVFGAFITCLIVWHKIIRPQLVWFLEISGIKHFLSKIWDSKIIKNVLFFKKWFK